MPTEEELPEDAKTWETAIAKAGLIGHTIHSAELASASKIKYEQFLLFRVVWKMHRGIDVSKVVPGLDKWISEAEKKLQTCKSWALYCKGFNKSAQAIEEGTFATVRLCQLDVNNTADHSESLENDTPVAHRTRGYKKRLDRQLANLHLETPSKSNRVTEDQELEIVDYDDPHINMKTPDTLSPYNGEESPISKEEAKELYPPSEDEQIVNFALIIFLKALTMHFNLASQWTSKRKAFHPKFGKAEYQARTDGYLDCRGEVKAIIEVKPAIRSTKQPVIQRQESAQVVGWITVDKEKPNGTERVRLHVAQDRQEIYLTVAVYDDNYIKYLTDANYCGPKSFMTMHQFGPWNTFNKTHMKSLGPILLAITLRAEYEAKEKAEYEAKENT